MTSFRPQRRRFGLRFFGGVEGSGGEGGGWETVVEDRAGRGCRLTNGSGKIDTKTRRADSRACGTGEGKVGAKEDARTCLLPQDFFFCLVVAGPFGFFGMLALSHRTARCQT